MTIAQSISHYMNLDYTLITESKLDFDNSLYYVARYKELNGLEGVGSTKKEAINDLLDVKEDWFKMSLKINASIPEPQKKKL